ncbi:MAG: class I SAM-dependent methyltransferase [Actinocatenispora sp.]
MLETEIMAYYRRGGERTRLAAGDGLLESLRTRDVLARVLPPAPATILDVGGATGGYAGWLTGEGYRVHVVDPVADHVREAAELPGVEASVGDARNLDRADGSADAVLLLGPLYHLQDRADRVRAWQEAGRVVRPGGPVVAATINRFASLWDGFVKDFFAEPAYRPMVERTLTDGQHRNLDGSRNWFTTAYFHHPGELAGEVTDAGLTWERTVSVEGPVWMLGDRLADRLADPDRTELLLDMLRRVEDEPSLLGSSSHLLTVARGPVPVDA